MTGARLPEGADTVVIREDTDERDPAQVWIVTPPKAQGAHVRARGSILRAGSLVLHAGAPLRGGEVGLLASLGRAVVPARRRPVVAIVPTGDELVEVGEPVGEAQLVNSSAWMLAQLVREAGALPRVSPIARDTFKDTRARVSEALRGADLLLTMGGVSVGDRDVVKDVMGALCGQIELWRVRVKPGKPLAFARTPQGAAWLGLPGNPVSSYVAFWAFVWPALRRLQGATPETLPTVEAVVEAEVRSTSERLELVRGDLRWEEGAWRFWPFAGQGSDDLTSARACTGLLHVPVGCARLERGAVGQVEVLPTV
jgi:molybdopterin molybdotransferase